MSDWGKGVINNIGWGQGADNDIGWGSIYDKSNAGETLLSGGGNTDAFIIEVKTDNAGTSNDNQFQFTGGQGDYDVVAKQGGVIVETFSDLSDAATITFASSGVYDLEITPKATNGFNRIAFDSGGDKLKMLDIKQWGTIVWSSFERAFRGSDTFVTATDVPNLSIVTNAIAMFFQTVNADPDVRKWNVTNIENMASMFRSSGANPDTTNWNVSSVTDMRYMFEASNLSEENLTACYENWSQLNLQQNVSFSAGTIKYNASGQAGRDTMVNTYNWTITDGGQV